MQPLSKSADEQYELLRELKRTLNVVLESNSHSGGAALSAVPQDAYATRDLLAWIERVLHHGLRRAVRLSRNSDVETPVTLLTVLRNISARIALPSLNTSLAFAMSFPHTKTDIGRGHVWVRSALEGRILGTTFERLPPNVTQALYEPYSIWHSTEQRLMAISLFQALCGLDFHFSNIHVEEQQQQPTIMFDIIPEPARRPHFLGISARHYRNPLDGNGILSFPRNGNGGIVYSPHILARREQTRKEAEIIKRKHAAWHEQQQQQGGVGDVATALVANSMSWFKEAVGTVVGGYGDAPVPSSPPQPVIQPSPIPLPPPPPPSLLGSKMVWLVRDSRTCRDAVLDWRIGVPNAISALLAMMQVDDSDEDVFASDPTLEDDAKYVSEVAALLSRLSATITQAATAATTTTNGNISFPLSQLATSVLKLFLRQLPTPLIPFEVFDALIECQRIGDGEARNRNVRLLVQGIPEENQPTLLALVDVLAHMCESGRTDTICCSNAMSSSLLRPKPGPDLGKPAEAAEVLQIMLEHREEIFQQAITQLRDRKVMLEHKIEMLKQWHVDARTVVEFDQHDALLRRLWNGLVKDDNDDEYPGGQGGNGSNGWKRRGFRSLQQPLADFRGCGYAALRHLVWLCETDAGDFAREMCRRYTGSEGTFPFVLGAAQMSRAVLDMIGIDSKLPVLDVSEVAQLSTWALLNVNDAPYRLFEVALRLLDHEWQKQKASAMDFNRLRTEVVLMMEDMINMQKPQGWEEFENGLKIGGLLLHSSAPPTASLPRVTTGRGSRDDGDDVIKVPVVLTPPPPSTNENDYLPQLMYPKRLDTATHDKSIHRPNDVENPPILDVAVHVPQIESVLPIEFRGYDWERVFSTETHGLNIDLFYQTAHTHRATLLVLQEVNGGIFGAFTTETWRPHYGELEYFGSGESFLFTFARNSNHELDSYAWSGANSYFMLATDESIAVGGGGKGFGLFVDGDFKAGTTASCTTFGNQPLLLGGNEEDDEVEFVCKRVELWGFVPKRVGGGGGGGGGARKRG